MTTTPETRVVPVNITKEMRNRVLENGGPQALAYALAAWPDLLDAAPPAPVAASAVARMRTALETIALHAPSLDAIGIRELCDEALAATPSSPNPVADNPAGDPVVNAPRVRELAWVDEEKYGLRMRVGRCLGLVYEVSVKAYSPGWIASLGGFDVIYDGDDEDAAIAACNADASIRVLACLEPGQASTIRYRNWRGEVAVRTIIPMRIWHGATEWHPEPQMMLRAWDVEKQAVRDFALADILPPETEVRHD